MVRYSTAPPAPAISGPQSAPSAARAPALTCSTIRNLTNWLPRSTRHRTGFGDGWPASLTVSGSPATEIGNMTDDGRTAPGTLLTTTPRIAAQGPATTSPPYYPSCLFRIDPSHW